MDIKLAKLLKALEIGYTSWDALLQTYSNCDKLDHVNEVYLPEVMKWSENGVIPESALPAIEKHLMLYADTDGRRIKDNIERLAGMPSTNPIVIETMSLIHKLC